MSKVEDSRARWNATFADSVNLSDMRASVRRAPQHNPCIKGYRSVCWKAFLLYQNLDRNSWPKSTRDSRSAYGSLKDHLMQVFEATKTQGTNDPLAEHLNSPGQSLKHDQALRAEILQDVERCMPEIPFFRAPENQAMLLNVLFVYCKINADLGYRQGMHELLAPILWVVHQDAASLDDPLPTSQDKILAEILDPQYVEHDAFSLFCIVMQTAKSFYEMSGVQQSPGEKGESPIVERSRRIHEQYLSKADPELATHLTSIDILPQIFVIRWIRLLFGREFPFDQVLALWDMIFAEDPSLTLVDHICLSMLLRLRWRLLQADYSSALTLLLRYPEPKSPQDVPALVSDAVYLSKHMDLQGGSTIIRKYSGKSPLAALAQSGGEPVKRKGTHTPHSSVDVNRTLSPLRSSSDYIQNHGGLEAILQGAAKNVYSRSEAWANKAIRGAVQNFQNNTLSPTRMQGASSRWSLDEGKIVKSDATSAAQALNILEERNQVLAGMLADAVGELNEQAKTLENQGSEQTATALTLATAKLHYVQVYLQDAQLPLDPQVGQKSSNNNLAPGDAPVKVSRSPPPSPTPNPRAGASNSARLQERRGKSPDPIATKSTMSTDAVRSPTDQYQQDPLSSATTLLAPSIVGGSASATTATTTATASPRVRPSIAESSYSWMLGDEKPKSNFVSGDSFSPSPSRGSLERQRSAARNKAGFLFGEDGGGKRQTSGQVDNDKKRGGDTDDGFTSPTLKGGVQPSSLSKGDSGLGPL